MWTKAAGGIIDIGARVTALLSLAVGGMAVQTTAATVPDPSQGDGRVSAFYTWTADLPLKAGAMLRSEPLPAELRLPGAARQDRVLYTSTDGVAGKGVVAVSGAVFIPKGPKPPGGWPIIAWAHGTLGMADICAPSWAARSYRDVQYLGAWLAHGYAVVATDYQGLGVPGPHPYLNARPEAYGVLDSLRSALAANYGLANKIVVVGQSQGGGAAVATAGFAPLYAPDLNVVGVVATGSPFLSPEGLAAAKAPDPDAVDPTLAYMFYLVMMVQQSDPNVTAETAFTPLAAPLLAQARISCVAPLESDIELLKLTRRNALQLGFTKAIASIGPRIIFPTVKFKMPIFVGTGMVDKDVPPEGQAALVAAACKAGSTIEWHTYPGQDHGGTVNTSLKDSLPFVANVFAEQPIKSTCR